MHNSNNDSNSNGNGDGNGNGNDNNDNGNGNGNGNGNVMVIGHCRNVRGLGKSIVVFRLFENIRCSNERSTKFESLNHE